MAGITIATWRLNLRELRRSDSSEIAAGLNNIAVSARLKAIPYPYNIEIADAFVEHCVWDAGSKERSNFHMAITLKSQDRLIGLASIKDLKRKEGEGTLAYWLSQGHWNKDIMTEAAAGLIGFAFGEMGLERVRAEAFSDNAGSKAILKKLGFVPDGERSGVRSIASGRTHNLELYLLLRRSWNEGGHVNSTVR